jgi:hypothetical protein
MDLLIATLVLEHDGDAATLAYSWDSLTGILALTGFRTVCSTISYVRVKHTLLSDLDTEISATLLITEYMDSNDIKEAILTYLLGAISGAQVEVVAEIPAAVTWDYAIEVTYFDFHAIEPALVASIDAVGMADPTTTEVIVPIPLASVAGITQARGRLMAWETSGSIYRSAMLDELDFTPAISTQAGVGKPQAMRGQLLLLAGYEDGFAAYTTDNVIIATYTGDDYVFRYTELVDFGIVDPRHVSAGQNKQLVYTSSGLYFVTPASSKYEVVSDVLDSYLAAYPWPLQVRYLENRFICIGLPFLLETDILLRSNRGLPAVPVPQLIDNNFVAFERWIVFDTALEKWGSCDTGAALLFGLTAANSNSVRLDKSTAVGACGVQQPLHTSQLAQQVSATRNPIEAWSLEGRGLGMVMPDGEVFLASNQQADSSVFIGFPRAQALGWTTYVEAHVELSKAIGPWTFDLWAYDQEGTAITAQHYASAQQDALTKASRFYLDSTAHYAMLQVAGMADLKQLRLSCFAQGVL